MRDNRSSSINNAITTKAKPEPFRVSDGVMKIGKFKTKKISDVPKYYLRWMLKNIDLDSQRIAMINDLL